MPSLSLALGDAILTTVMQLQYGVVRDVFQNHLTQALVYALMHLEEADPRPSSADPSSSAAMDSPQSTFGI